MPSALVGGNFKEQWEGIRAFSFRKRTWARAHPKLSGNGEPAAIKGAWKDLDLPMMMATLAGSHLYPPDLGEGGLFPLPPTFWGLQEEGPIGPSLSTERCAQPTPSRPCRLPN